MTVKTDYANINGIWSAVLIEELWRLGVRHGCIAPGSRSAPLTFAVADHQGMTRHIHFDERGLGFFALGLAKATGEAVALITTSGTAVANLYPAIIEAHQSGISLVVLTADRPPELIDCGANQAIDQLNIFGNYTGATLDLPTPDRSITLRWLLGSIDQAYARSSALGLPVHINCMFREPLYPHQLEETVHIENDVYLASIQQWITSLTPYTEYFVPELTRLPDIGRWQHFADGKGLIVAGRVMPETDVNVIVQLSERLGWPLIADVQSQLHGHPKAIRHADLLLASSASESLFNQVDRVLQIGGYLTCKRLDQFIARHHWQEYWMLDPAPRRVDTGQRQSVRLVGDIDSLCHQLLLSSEAIQANREWSTPFTALAETLGEVLKSQRPSQLNEQWLGASLGELLPSGSSLFLGNSLPIRMVDIFSTHHLPRVYASRGVSGIDGLIATAAGCAAGNQGPMVLLIGDISFLHDLNSLQLAAQCKTPLVIVLINNDGGGIFYVTTKGCSNDTARVTNDYFVTPHGLSVQHAAELFRIDYSAPQSIDDFTAQFNKACSKAGCTIIEVFTESGLGAKSIEQAVTMAKTL
ncbi:2-succinyl-5-enolpyruvyl-6-hydroxy-3-cyclohexene-1-carboxylic-acid synthase [Endozoicomonas sp. YOMI1]|uniref:2-succinyl-5-enolpyruvyl-6-hydroxy-3- cyclohexene-1-carboxylic-acid synthase n=1 Tax=Endozoicomonas sp. YOMI1 TaxID=2828739 RepID=UPI002147AD61|nr:2-succinyl-5-enolpyruvyl-6-hydroxy-3-cyclohexene-1-carboxylic-acid synthase [Endozoicomonas sp. YOMI1]